MKHFARLGGDLQENGTINWVSRLPIDADARDTHPTTTITPMSPRREPRQNIET